DNKHYSRTYINEVNKLLSNMRIIKFSEELILVKQILIAADIKIKINGNPELKTTSILAENVLSMCLKEATTNIVRHSKANLCEIKISETNEETSIMIKDNG